ncbi:MAG: DUF6788 family protein [Terriglobales bacterium]
MRKRKALMGALLAATRSMVQGGLSETSRRCGKRTCPCAHDAALRHGPHLYLTYRDDGASRSLYVPAAAAPVARAAHDAWATFWEMGCALAALNREALRRRWQKIPPAPTRPGRRRAADD